MEYLMYGKYLFKAKRLEDCNWKIGYLVKNQEWAYIVKPLENRGVEFETVDPNTICQCTGLKDRNGKLIWENDIASYSDLITGDKKIICIEWNKMQASFVRKYRSPMGLQYIYIDEYIASRMEIIGNIFDNPELLESEG